MLVVADALGDDGDGDIVGDGFASDPLAHPLASATTKAAADKRVFMALLASAARGEVSHEAKDIGNHFASTTGGHPHNRHGVKG